MLRKILLSFAKIILLVVVIPFLLLLLVEGLLRIINADEKFFTDKERVILEMPNWLLAEENSRMKATTMHADKRNVGWMNLFETGDGFRVRLKKNIDQVVENNFSFVSGDKNYRVTANSLGFRGEEPSDEDNLMVFGDSSSFGWGVERSEIYHELVGSELGLNVANFAIPGDSSEYGKLIFDRFIDEYPASVMIFSFGANDHKALYHGHREQTAHFKNNRSPSELKKFLDKSVLFQLIQKSKTKSHAELLETVEDLPRRHAVTGEEYRQNLQYMFHRAKASGVDKIVFMTVCVSGRYVQIAKAVAFENDVGFFSGNKLLLGSIEDIKAGKIYPELTAQVVEKVGQDALDANPRLYITSDGCHPNTLGHRLLADRLLEILENYETSRTSP